jgi:hypothetical protein
MTNPRRSAPPRCSGVIPEHWTRRQACSPGSLDSLKFFRHIHRTLRRLNRRLMGTDRVMDNTREQFPPEEFEHQQFSADEFAADKPEERE